MQKLCTKLRFLALQSTQALPSLSASRRLLQSNLFQPNGALNPSTITMSHHLPSQSTPCIILSTASLLRHVSSRERAKRRKRMTPRTSKIKKIKMKSYSSYKSRFRTMSDGNIRRWREGKNHNVHLKSKKSRRRLRQPAIVPAAYSKVMKKLNFCA